jgi:hypothetical protein
MFRIVVLALITVALAGCSEDIKGSGTLATETRQVQKFTSVSLSSSGAVVIEQTGTESLTVTTDDNLLPLITTEVKNGTLELSTAPNKWISPTKLVFKITVGDLRKIEVSGSGSVTAAKLEGPALSADISGSGSMKLAGKVDDLKLSLSGSGSYDCAELSARRASVDVSGSGSVRVNASEELKAEISGSGSIRYLGSPKLKVDVSGSGSVKPAS